MNDAETILKLIETVEPNDEFIMSKIDMEVWLFINKGSDIYKHWLNEGPMSVDIPQYTRSRDALRAIRPERLELVKATLHCNKLGKYYWFADDGEITFGSGCGLPTEELAELHAIIQAIEYERTQK